MTFWDKLGFRGQKSDDKPLEKPTSSPAPQSPYDKMDVMVLTARMLKQEGNLKEAEVMYKILVDTGRALGDKNPIYATFVSNLGNFYHETKRHAEAEPLYRESLALFLKTPLGEANPTYAKVLHGLATLYEETGQTARAEECYLQLVELKRRTSR